MQDANLMGAFSVTRSPDRSSVLGVRPSAVEG